MNFERDGTEPMKRSRWSGEKGIYGALEMNTMKLLSQIDMYRVLSGTNFLVLLALFTCPLCNVLSELPSIQQSFNYSRYFAVVDP